MIHSINSIKRTFYSPFAHWSREKVLQPENIFQNICYKIMNNNFSELKQKSSVKQKLSAKHTFSYIKWHWVDVNSFFSVTHSWKAAENTGKHGVIVLESSIYFNFFNLIVGVYKVLLAWGIHFLQLSLNRNPCLEIWGLALNWSAVCPDERLEPFCSMCALKTHGYIQDWKGGLVTRKWESTNI